MALAYEQHGFFETAQQHFEQVRWFSIKYLNRRLIGNMFMMSLIGRIYCLANCVLEWQIIQQHVALIPVNSLRSSDAIYHR